MPSKSKNIQSIPNTEYITISEFGVFVGGERVSWYREEKISFFDKVREYFAQIQKQYPEIHELHIGAFKTSGKHAKQGYPSMAFGRNAWYRARLFDGKLTRWVFDQKHDTAPVCAKECAVLGTYTILKQPEMCSAILNRTGCEQGEVIPDISNTRYMTITPYGISVGDKYVKNYCGESIGPIDEITGCLSEIRKKYPTVRCLHAGIFKTTGKYAKPGGPTGTIGPNTWFRVVRTDNHVGPWVFHSSCESASNSMFFFAACCRNLGGLSAIWPALLELPEKSR